MPITDVIDQISNSGIIPIEVFVLRPEDDYEVFVFNGNISEYINILSKINIKSVFIEKRIVREDDFINYLDEEEAELFAHNNELNIDEEGMIDLVLISPELEKYKRYIGQIMEIRIIAIVEGKEFQIKVSEEWGSELNILYIRTGNILEEMIEKREMEAEHRKKKRH